MNLIDRDLTAHQITQTLTPSRLVAQLEQTREIRLFTHTQQVDWSRQGESDCSIKRGILRLLSSVQCSEIREYLWSDVMEWIHDEYSMVGTHRLCADASAGEIWFCLDMWSNGADREYSSSTERGRDRRGEQILE